MTTAGTPLFDPETDHFNKNNLSDLLAHYKQPQSNRLIGLKGNRQFRHKSCLQDIVFGPQFTRLVIKKFDEQVVKNAFEIKPGPIPGFDVNIVIGQPNEPISTKQPESTSQLMISGKHSLPIDQSFNSSIAGKGKKMKKSDPSTTKRKGPFIPQTIAHF